MRKYFVISLALIFLMIFLGSCSEKSEDIVLVNVPDISEYTLIRSDNASDSLKRTATALKARLEELTGASIKIGTDFGSSGEKEILLGQTNRSASKNAIQNLKYNGSFVIEKTGNKIVICGKTDDSTALAADFWLENMVYEKHICLPEQSGGYVYNPNVKIEKISADGFDLSEYSIYYTSPELENEALEIKALLASYADVILPVTDHEYLTEKHILLAFSEDMFSSEMKVSEGEISITYAYFDMTWGSGMIKSILDGAKGTLNMTSEFNNISTFDQKCSYTKEELMQLLENVYSSEQVIIGEQTGVSDSATVENTLNNFKKVTGEDLALIGIDIRQANLNKLGESGRNRVLSDLISFASKGGIITASAHFSNPHDGDPNIHNPRGTLGDDSVWAELVTKGTDINVSFTKELKYIADFLEVLQKADIPVIWRPLHETNANWFWFSMVQNINGSPYKVSEESFTNLWKYIYDYMTTERGLTNLIWEFSPNIGNEGSTMVAPLYGYPGDEYVDIVGFDWYSNGDYSQINSTNTYKELTSTGKIVNITEFGPSDQAKAENVSDQPQYFSSLDLLSYLQNIRDEGKNIAYLLTWVKPWNIEAMGYGDEFMNDAITLSLDDVNKLFNEIRRK